MATALVAPGVAAEDTAPDTDPLVDFTHEPGTEAEPAGLDWIAVPLDEAEIPSRRFELTGWSGGFAFLERPQGPGAKRHAAWTSADGRSWTKTLLPAAVKEPFWLEPYRDGLVLASEQRRGYRAHDIKMDFWRSADGVDWRLAGSLEAEVPRSTPDLALWPMALFPLDERMTLLGILRDRWASGGRVGDAVEFVASGRGAPVPKDVARVWTSRGGAAWRERALTGLADSRGELHVETEFASPDAAWVVRTGAERALLRSPDGIRWEPAAPIPEHFEEGGQADMLWAADGLLLLGDNADREGNEGCGNRLGVWRLDEDVASWTEVLDRQPAFVNGAAAEGDWVVLTGRSWCPGDWAWTLISRDGGRSWDPDLSWVGDYGTCLGQVAIHDGNVVVFGCGKATEDGPLAWVAFFPPDPEPNA
ncbi:MAG: hypothetical protein AB1Z67_14315 [Candidatus Limnocylindrales bacterium]